MRRLTHTNFYHSIKIFKKAVKFGFKTDDTELFEDPIEYFKKSGFEIEYMTYDLHNSDFQR